MKLNRAQQDEVIRRFEAAAGRAAKDVLAHFGKITTETEYFDERLGKIVYVKHEWTYDPDTAWGCKEVAE